MTATATFPPHVTAHRALIGTTAVLWVSGLPVAWAIAGGDWNRNAAEAQGIVDSQPLVIPRPEWVRELATAAPTGASSAPSGSRLIAQWFDSDLPSQRTRGLELWRGADGRTVAWKCEREHPSDVWPPPLCMGYDFSAAQAGVLAERLGLDPYLVR